MDSTGAEGSYLVSNVVSRRDSEPSSNEAKKLELNPASVVTVPSEGEKKDGKILIKG